MSMPNTINTDAVITEIKRRRKIANRKTGKGVHSKLNRYQASLFALRRAGASYRDLVFWLKDTHHVDASHTTVIRWMKNVSELEDRDSDFFAASISSRPQTDNDNEKKFSIPEEAG
jgi:hypothetical protein